MMRILRLSLMAMCVAGALSATAEEVGSTPAPEPAPPAGTDLMLYGDPIDPTSGQPAVILPGAPWIQAGADEVLGTEDDDVRFDSIGDVDLVVRVGPVALDRGMPLPDPKRGKLQRGVAEPFNLGTPIDFVVIPSDGRGKGGGQPVVPPYWEGLPILIAAFGDLDGDGYIGVTHLDGDPDDVAQESAELEPVGTRYALASGDRASGQIKVFAGGPRGAPLRIALTATAFTGTFDEEFLSGLVPNGPVVSTSLPFLPEFDPVKTLRLGVFGLLPAAIDGRVAFELKIAGLPDPSLARWGEAFTLRLDGSDPTIGIAEVESGAMAGFGIAATPDSLVPSSERRLRPGKQLGKAGTAIETPRCLHLADDGDFGSSTVHVVPLDLLGNVAMPDEPTWVTVQTQGTVRILSPDRDGDPMRENVRVVDASGAELILDDSGGQFDDQDLDRILLDGGGRKARIDVSLADPDVDDDGVVGVDDANIVRACEDLKIGDPEFNPRLDLDGDGRIAASDVSVVLTHLGETAVPDREIPRGQRFKERKWKQPKLKRPMNVRALKMLEKRDEEAVKRRKKERKGLKGEPKWDKLRKGYCDGS